MKLRFSIVTSILIAGGLLLGLAGCGQKPKAEEGLPVVRFQTDWYPQAEHGGYYQAVVDGTFAAAGIDVDILKKYFELEQQKIPFTIASFRLP